MQPITDKYFYKEMAKIKEKGARGQTAVPPKKSASAYIIFQKEVSQLSKQTTPILLSQAVIGLISIKIARSDLIW